MSRLARVFFFFLVFNFLVRDYASCEDKAFDEIVAGVNEKFDRIETMTTNVVRTSRKGNNTVEEKWNYFYKKPDRIRIDYLKPSARFLVLNGDSFVEYIPEIKKARVMDLSKYDSKKKADFLERVFYRVSILGIRLGGITAGSIDIKKVKLEDFDAYFVDSKAPNYQLWTDAVTGALLKHVIYDDDNNVVYSTKGADFKKFGGEVLLPQKVTIVLPDENEKSGVIKSEMRLNNLKVNEGIADSFFEFKIPEDVEIIKQ